MRGAGGRGGADVTRGLRLALAAVLLFGFVGCSDDPGGDPEARADVLEAIRAMADPEPASIRLQLPYATADDLFGLSVGIERERAEFVEGAVITIKNDFGPDPLAQVFSLKIDLEAGSIEARQIRDDVYLRGDLAALAEAGGVDPRPLARTLSNEPLLRPLLRPAFRGDWIHVFGAGELLGNITRPDRGAGRTEQAAEAFAQAVENAAAVTPAGEDATGTKYHVELRLDLFSEAFFDAAEGLVPKPPPEEIDAVPDEELTFDVWLDDERIRRVEADISQLIDLLRTGTTGKRPPLILRIDVDPFDADLRRPRPDAGIPAATFFRLLSEGGAR